ncbi:MAG TPA: FHA domain-containing protein [Ktedonobacteraceae bacterium]
MPTLEDGQLFERYRVHKWLGSGIAGESYEAEDRILQRKVTLKLIHPWATLPDAARRQFFREMQGISLLNHPYLATVLDYGEIEGRIYVARRYVSSGSLLGTNGRFWFHPPLPVANAFKYAHQLAQALQYIHQHGYLHGSFTFANVLVLRGPNSEHETDYAPFLMADIGLATFVRRFGHPRIGTFPVSAAPEQLGKRVTPASDQFALAVLLYFWLAGRPPYLGTSSEVEHQKLSEIITPLSILNPGVTLEQDSIVLRALTVYPEDRYPSVLNFTEELIASLSSANRLYAPPLTPQSETSPVANTHKAPDKVVANRVETETQEEPARHIQNAATDTTAEELSMPTPSSQSQTKPYHSALEELLALPETNTGDVPSNNETNIAADEEHEESTEDIQQEDFALFPALPETPPVGEIPAQAEFAFIASEKTTEQQTNKQTGPLATEPDMDALYNQAADKPALEVPSDLPDNTDSPPLDEHQPALEDAPTASGPDEPSSIDEEEIPTVPQAGFAISEEGLIIYSLDDFPPFSELISPIILPDEPLLSNEENIPTVPLREPAASANEDMAPHPSDKPASLENISTPANPQVEVFQAAEDERPLVEQTNRQVASQATSEEIIPAVPPIEPANTPVESVEPLSSNEPALLEDAEDANTLMPPKIELAPVDEDPLILHEPDPPQLADTSDDKTAAILETVDMPQAQISSPIQEAHETGGATYPPIDEAIIAPRLLISSPYTSSSYEFLLIDEETNIGRAGTSNLYLEQDNLTSRHHALLKRVGERALIFDKRSHNGVFLNGQKIEVGRGYELADGDHIGIGNYELIFRAAPAGHVSQLI